MNDELVEYLIKLCYQRMLKAETKSEQMHWWKAMGMYVAKRSPQAIELMEREKGLA